MSDTLGVMSPLLKIKRAVDGDDFFCGRVEIACEMQEIPYTRKLLLYVAGQVSDAIVLSGEDGTTVNTFGVTDESIFSAIASHSANEETSLEE